MHGKSRAVFALLAGEIATGPTRLRQWVCWVRWLLFLVTTAVLSGCEHFDNHPQPLPFGMSPAPGFMPSATEYSDWQWKQSDPTWKMLPGDPQR